MRQYFVPFYSILDSFPVFGCTIAYVSTNWKTFGLFPVCGIHVQVFMGTKVSSSLVSIYGSEIAGLWVKYMFNFIKNCQFFFFSKLAVPFSFLPAINESSNYSASLKAINFCLFFFQIELVFIIENKINIFFQFYWNTIDI